MWFLTWSSVHLPVLITQTTKEVLQHIAANHKPGEPFKLDEIMERQLSPENIKFSFL
jgi:hypothetical protein